MEQSPVEVPFLDKSEEIRDESFDEEVHQNFRRKGHFCCKLNAGVFAFHLVFIICYTSVITATLSAYFESKSPAKTIYSPANVAIRYESVRIDDSPSDVGKSLYVGNPSPEKDAEWYKILRYHNIRLTDQDLHGINSTSVSLGTGGYQGMMGVMHELHCLKLVREALHPEYYWKGKSEKEIRSMRGHNEHCIDALRMATMCRPDTTIFPFQWKSGTRLPSPIWSRNHECANWDLLQDWMSTRVVDVQAPGPSYPDGQRIEEPNGPTVIPPHTFSR